MATEKYTKLLHVLIEMQKINATLLGKLSVQHIDANGEKDPNKAFGNVIAKQETILTNISSLNYTCNKTKLYDLSRIPNVLKNPIVIETLDTTLQRDILYSLEGFPVSRAINPNKKVKIGDYCCNNCLQCKVCISKLAQAQQCRFFIYKQQNPNNVLLQQALEKEILLRNLISHLTSKTLQNFLDGKEQFPDFPNVYTWEDLSKEFTDAAKDLCNYMCDKTNFTNRKVIVLRKDIKDKKLKLIEEIMDKDVKSECDMTLMNNLKELLEEQHNKQMDELKKLTGKFLKIQKNEIKKFLKEK